MRTLLKYTLDTEASNKAIQDGSLPGIIKNLMGKAISFLVFFFQLLLKSFFKGFRGLGYLVV